MPYIYSTLSNDQSYAKYPPKINPKAITKPDRLFFVAGRANILNDKFDTPRGVVTKISKEDLEVLKTVKSFSRHLAAGYLTIDASDKQADPETVAADMTPRDSSAQLEDSDFEEKEKTEG